MTEFPGSSGFATQKIPWLDQCPLLYGKRSPVARGFPVLLSPHCRLTERHRFQAHLGAAPWVPVLSPGGLV